MAPRSGFTLKTKLASAMFQNLRSFFPAAHFGEFIQQCREQWADAASLCRSNFRSAVTSPDSSFGDRRDAWRRFSSKIGAPSLISFPAVLCPRIRFFLPVVLCQFPLLLLSFRAQ